jgi:hypothetical protein
MIRGNKMKPEDFYRNTSKNKPKLTPSDSFLKIALPYILAIVMGFTLILLGFIFLIIAALSLVADSNEVPGGIWFTLGLFSEIIGVYLMRKYLILSPTPGSIKST